jgi:hypothetical protein
MISHRVSSQANVLRPLHAIAGAIAMVLVIGTIDYITGAQVSIAPLYLVPIAVATWFVSLRAGLLLSGLSAVVRLQDLWLTTHHFSHPLIPYWNGVVEMGFFVVVAYILSRLRSTTERWAILAMTDPLTGVLNRRAFTETATREVARAERYHGSHADARDGESSPLAPLAFIPCLACQRSLNRWAISRRCGRQRSGRQARGSRTTMRVL